MSGLDMASGPPIATGLPRLRHISMISIASSFCGSIPPVMTRSAQAKSASVSSSALRLTRRRFHDDGSSAATVIRPSGGAGQRAPQMSHTACRFQNEFGLNFGNTRSAFGLFLVIRLLLSVRLRERNSSAGTTAASRREIALVDQYLFLPGITARLSTPLVLCRKLT